MIAPLEGEVLLTLFAQLFVILSVALLLGRLARVVGMPAVVGELLTGIVLGPSLLGIVAPGTFETLFPSTAEQFHLLEAISWLGVVFLLLTTGLEMDIDRLRRRAGSAALVSTTGVAVPFALGLGVTGLLPAFLVVDPTDRLGLALFLATAMSISAIPVIAHILVETGLAARPVGQVMLASATLTVLASWLLLSLVIGFVQSGRFDVDAVGVSLLTLCLFTAFAFTVGRRGASAILRRAGSTDAGPRTQVAVVAAFALGAGSLTAAFGFEATLGALLAGVAVGRDALDVEARRVLEDVSLGVFAPLFFGTAGLRADLSLLVDPAVALVGAALLIVATVGKLVGVTGGALVAGFGRRDALAMGVGLNARGALEIVVATIGLSLGLLTPALYTIIVLVAIVTSVLAAALLPVVATAPEKRRLVDRPAGRL
ncbi:cation:proton antiporter [Haloprofundus salilacus]|uniref:cation:proton antiporter n=1 Tax=Haloprofundus salilacus TaxID=2876190 RepID=UPI001CCD51C9|nr:cation:proton antiporter [Haloprofundus salilacus]